MNITPIIQWASVLLNLGSTVWYITRIRKQAAKDKETFEKYKQGAKYLQQASDVLEDCKKERENLTTFCEKCKSLIKLKK